MRNLIRSNSRGKQPPVNFSSEEEEAKSLAASCKKKPYSCRICHKSFQTHSILVDHSTKEHPQQQHQYHHHYSSPIPPIPRRRETTVSLNSQNRNLGGFMASVIGHPCSICQRIFASVHDRDAHQRTSHQPQTVTQTSTRVDNSFSKTYLSASGIIHDATTSTANKHGHSRRNTASSGNVSRKSSSMKVFRHNASSSSSSSSSSKPYQCEVCTRTFSRLSHLTAHEQIHSEEKRFKCSECGKDFLRAASLSEHQRCHAEQNWKNGKKKTKKRERWLLIFSLCPPPPIMSS